MGAPVKLHALPRRKAARAFWVLSALAAIALSSQKPQTVRPLPAVPLLPNASTGDVTTAAAAARAVPLAIAVTQPLSHADTRQPHSLNSIKQPKIRQLHHPDADQPPSSIARAAAARVPKVALMFLTRGPLPLSPLWLEWLKDVDGGVLPSFELAHMGCSQQQLEAVRALGTAAAATSTGSNSIASIISSVSGSSLYKRQQLFNIYVHAPPTYNESYSKSSVFHGREVRQRINTTWGTHSLVAAARHMLREALEDHSNTHFILMSESDVPLWPAGLLYLQLTLAEPLSRVSACVPVDKSELDRINYDQGDILGFPHDQWRKNSQWFVLSRHHAQLYVDDEEIDARFRSECYIKKDMVTWKDNPGDRWCISDEHYLSVLLAARGQEGACSCSVPGSFSVPVFLKWTGTPHPTTYTVDDLLTNSTLHQSRKCSAAAAEAALEQYRRLLVRPEDWDRQTCEAAAAEAQQVAAAVTAVSEAAAAAAAISGAAVTGGNSTAKPVVDSVQQEAAASRDAPAPGLLPPYSCKLWLRKVEASSNTDLSHLAKAMYQFS